MDLSRSNLTAKDFDRFLSALDPDYERAGVKYEELRAKLVKFFMLRGSEDPEDLADQTINIAVRNIQNVEKPHDILRYLYGVAKRISFEHVRHSQPLTSVPESSTAQETKPEITVTCLDECMAKLTSDSRDLILRYYEAKGATKIRSRREMAQELGTSINALRIRSHHIRARLEKCMAECLKKQNEEH